MINSWVATASLLVCLLTVAFLVYDNDVPVFRAQVKDAGLKRSKRSAVRLLEQRAREAQQCPRYHDRKQLEQFLKEKKLFIKTKTPSTVLRRFTMPQRYVRKLVNSSVEVIDLVDCMAEATARSNEDDLMEEIDSVSIAETHLRHLCQSNSITCDPHQKYRTIDGSCNNLKSPHWGMVGVAQSRLLKPQYDNKMSFPRTKSYVEKTLQLPNSRDLSVAIIKNKGVAHNTLNAMVTFFGQFTDHDIGSTPVSMMSNEEEEMIMCCGEEFDKFPDLRHPECFPIPVSRSDPVYSRHATTCMDFVRSAASMDLFNCKLGYREQMNQVTSYLDVSQLYGSDSNIAKQLRGTNGRLRVSPDPLGYPGGILPLDKEEDLSVCRPEFGFYCLGGGDFRANEQGFLSSFHTLWVREHNRIVDELEKINPGWTDEVLYQEARKIVIAETQAITYEEWLPKLLGPEIMERFYLNVKDTRYNQNVNPTIVNSFSAAAFRVGHTLLSEQYKLMRNDFIHNDLNLTDMFENVVYNHMGYMDYFLRGLIHQRVQEVDSNLPEAVQHNLFKKPDEEVGLDLAALNIQRGRDHGLPGYSEFYKLCSGKKMTWEVVKQIMDEEIAYKLEKQYKYIEDIDLWLGGINEHNVPGGMVGPTFSCIIGQQFFKLKFGDRFFFSHRNEERQFSDQQLHSIRQTTMARIVCKNTQSIKWVPKDAFVYEPDRNSLVDCEDLPDINFRYWA